MGSERGGSHSVGVVLEVGFGDYRLRPVWAEGERQIPRLPAVLRALSSSVTPSPAPSRSIGPQARVGARTPGQHPPPKLRAAHLSEQGRVGQSSQAGAEVGTKSPRPLLAAGLACTDAMSCAAQWAPGAQAPGHTRHPKKALSRGASAPSTLRGC